MRFGPTGTGLSLLTTSVLSAWAVVHGLGPFTTIAPPITTTAVTLSLIVVATTLTVACDVDRRAASDAAGAAPPPAIRRSALAAVGRARPTPEQPDVARLRRVARPDWRGARSRLVDALRHDRCSAATYTRCTPGPTPGWTSSRTRLADQLFVGAAQSASKETVLVHDRRPRFSRRLSVFGAGASIPLIGEGHVLGALTLRLGRRARAVERSARERTTGWRSAGGRAETQALGECAARERGHEIGDPPIAVERRRRHRSQRARAAGQRSLAPFARTTEWMDGHAGGNLLERCRAAFDDGNQLAGELVGGVAAVLDGSRKWFTIEHRTDGGSSAEWSSITAVPLNRPEGGAVLTRADITELRRAEMEAQRSRQELAHVSRVSTVGEMTASLAHQLNQPLTAIMANAQAARASSTPRRRTSSKSARSCATSSTTIAARATSSSGSGDCCARGSSSSRSSTSPPPSAKSSIS